MRKKLFVILMSIAMIMTFVPTFAFAGEALPESVDVKLDSNKYNQKVYFNSKYLYSIPKSLGGFSFNIVFGAYNGDEQTFELMENGGISAEYSTDGGKTWASEAPTFKNPTINLLDLAALYPTKDGGTWHNESDCREMNKKMFNDNAFQMRIISGDASSQPVNVLPVIIPQKLLLVEYKSPQLNFAPGKKVKPSDVLQLKTVKISDKLYNILPRLFFEEGGEITEQDIFNLIDSVWSIFGKVKGDIDSKYQGVAKTFLDKYFKLYDFPKSGTNNGTQIMSSTAFDANKMCDDLEKDNKLSEFVGYYDVSPLAFQTRDINLEYNKWIKISGGTDKFAYGSDISISLNTNAIKGLGISTGLKSIEDRLFNVKALVNYSTEYNKISASNVTKTYHVKKAKTLSKSKSFTYKAKAEYGKVTFKKVDGSSKLTINKKTGKVTVKKGLKRGKTYSIKVLMRAPGKQLIKTIKVKIAK